MEDRQQRGVLKTAKVVWKPKIRFQTAFVQINSNLFIKKLIIQTYHFFIFHKHLVQHEYAHNMHS